MRAEGQGYFGPLTSYGLEKHHVMHGVANRKIAEKYGLTVYLCEKDHRTGAEAVHKSRETDLKLIRAGQRRFEQVYSRREWMEAFGKNYLYEDSADNNVLEQVLQQLFKDNKHLRDKIYTSSLETVEIMEILYADEAAYQSCVHNRIYTMDINRELGRVTITAPPDEKTEWNREDVVAAVIDIYSKTEEDI
jgi:hypothetical protein